MVIVACAIAFAEKDFHALRHVYTHESIEPSNHGGNGGKRDRFRDSVVAQVPFAERSDLEVESHNECAVETLVCNVSSVIQERRRTTYSEDTEDDEEHDLEKVPISVVRHLE